MSPKKKRPPAAQNLIDSLLDERTPAPPPPPEARTGTFKIVANNTQAGNNTNHTGHTGQTKSKMGNTPVLLASETLSVSDKNESDKVTVTGAGSEESRAEHSAHHMPSTDPSFNHDEATLHNTPVSFPDGQLSDETGHSNFDESIDRASSTEVKTVVQVSKSFDGPGAPRALSSSSSSKGFSSAEAALKQADSLRIAQSHITELEQELERMRRENEQLATAGETLRRRGDELLSKAERLDIQFHETKKIADEEKKVLRSQLQQKDRESLELRGRLEEMEGRLESNFKKIRVRERELEHRLEIIKAESATIVSSKDKMILELKRQIDQITHENEYGKNKSQELFNQYKGKQDTIRRVVRALRIALTILEGDEDGGTGHDEAG